jgi:hypothetical protein
MARYPALPDYIREALASIEPSRDRDIAYFPCRATLADGRQLDTVYIVSEGPYRKYWGIYPEDDHGKSWIRIEDAVKVEESPTRLPARFANELYKAGESGMGYTIFKVVFNDGQQQTCATGNAVDFIQYPAGKSPADVVAVLPHQGREDQPVRSPRWYWCLYSEGTSPKPSTF